MEIVFRLLNFRSEVQRDWQEAICYKYRWYYNTITGDLTEIRQVIKILEIKAKRFVEATVVVFVEKNLSNL